MRQLDDVVLRRAKVGIVPIRISDLLDEGADDLAQWAESVPAAVANELAGKELKAFRCGMDWFLGPLNN